MDYMAIVSNGVYPTPTPTGQIRSMLNVSYGLIDFVITAVASSYAINRVLSIGSLVSWVIKEKGVSQ